MRQTTTTGRMHSAAPFIATRLSPALYLLQDPLGCRCDVVTHELLCVLRIRTPLPLVPDPAVRSLPVGLPDNVPDSVRALDSTVLTTLEDLVGRGWLVPHERFLTQWASHGAAAPPPRIATVAVTTRNRPASLKRCVESILTNRALYGRTHGVLVADDSDAPDVRAANVTVLTSLARRFRAPVFYVGRTERHALVRALERRTGLSRALLEFAFLPAASCSVPTVGANRNAVLAATTGSSILSCDDDVVWAGARPPVSAADLVLGSIPDPTVIRFFADRQAVQTALQWRTADITAAHETTLGRSIGDLVVQHHGRVRCTAFSERLCRAADRAAARVRVTSLGIAGDSGMSSTRDYVFLRGESQRHLFANGWIEGCPLPTREIVRAAEATTVTEGFQFMTTAVGFDNASLCMPFLPLFRNSDGVFAEVMRACAEDAYFAHIPWVLLHDPPEPRKGGGLAPSEDAARTRASDVLIAWIRAAPMPSGAGTEADRLRALGEHLVWLSDSGTALFVHQLREMARALYRDRIAALAERWDACANIAPASWKENLCQQMAGLGRAVRSDVCPVPDECSTAGLVRGSAALSFQQVVKQFGRLLVEWPSIVEHASGLQETVAVPMHARRSGGARAS